MTSHQCGRTCRFDRTHPQFYLQLRFQLAHHSAISTIQFLTFPRGGKITGHCPESRNNPQRANGSKHEARSKYERKIDHASFQNRPNISQRRPLSPWWPKYEGYHWT